MKRPISSSMARPNLRRVYNRERVFSEIDKKLDYSLIWVDGQAGAGKTTLVSSYLQYKNCHYRWFRIDESDNNLANFLYRFSSELSCFLPKTSQSLNMLSFPFQLDFKVLFKSMFNELYQNIDTPFYLIIDDCHLISNSDFHNMLIEAIISLDAGQIHTIIISRYKPPEAYSRLRARQKIHRLDKQYLNWNEDEIIALTLVLSNKSLAQNYGKMYFEITNGWVSGVVLLIEMLKDSALQTSDITVLDKDFLFEYFASEVFENMEESTQILLMKSSFLDEINEKKDKLLLGGKNLKLALENLCDKNYFTSKSENKKNTYYFHLLFKDFLQKKSCLYFKPTEIVDLKCKIADHLKVSGKFESAINLYVEIEDWEKAAPIIIQQADKFISQGKRHLVLHWASRFNSEDYDKFIWLRYWEATCYLATDQDKSYCMFLKLITKFKNASDVNGEYYVICGILESVLFSFNYYDRLTPWIEIVTQKYSQGVKPNHIDLQARLSANMHTALLFSNPSHKDLIKWEENVCLLMKILKITLNDDHRVLVGVNLFYQYLSRGEKLRAEKILSTTQFKKPSGSANPVSQGAWYVMASINAWMNGEADKAKKAADAGMKVAEESGIYFWFNLLLLQKTYACLINMELKEAQSLLTVFSLRENNSSQLILSMYYDACSQLEYLQGDFDNALANKKLCMIEINKMSMPYAVPGYRLGLAEIQIARGEYRQAKDYLNKSRIECKSMNGDLYLYRCYLLDTQLSLKIENYSEAKKNLISAMNLGEFRGFESHVGWNAENITTIYEFALRENINTDYVIHCIKKRNLHVNINVFEFDNWDWAVKIYTLGEFRIMLDNTSLSISGKSQRKPIMLLKAILSFGIWRISQTHLAEKLWPDADGAESMQSLYTTIHRLRRLIGTKSVLVKDGCIGLNPDLVWVDVGLAKYYVSKIINSTLDTQILNKKSMWVERLFDLYKAKFFKNELDDVWVFQFSEELHHKVLSSLNLYAKCLSEKHEYEAALLVLKKICLLDMLNEKNYYDQISLLLLLKRYPEAVIVYNECRNLISRVLGVMPSAKLSKLLDKELEHVKLRSIN